MIHSLPKLTFAYDSLEPFIDKQTMEIHHTKHHQAYIDKLNSVLEKYPDLADIKLENLMTNLKNLKIDAKDITLIRNHGGGHLNHSFFWNILGKTKEIDKILVDKIHTTFNSLEEFKKIFSEQALSFFGSGWTWLVEDDKGILKIYCTPNQDSPIINGDKPLIGLDLWEHAYYLKYQNRRVDYISAWWNVLKLI